MTLASKIASGLTAAKMTLSVATNRGVVPASYKSMVLIEPTSVCNLACPLCPTGTKTLERANKFIPMDIFDRIVELTAPVAEGFILNLFGEPTFHPRFSEILAKTSHLPTWLSTNLSYGKQAVQELKRWPHLRVICSVDTLDPKQYEEYRVGGSYDTVLSNLAELASGECEVYPQFLIAADDHDEPAYHDFAKSYGVPIENIILKEKFESFRLDATDRPVPGRCHSCYTGIYFNCDGFWIPCCNNVRSELHIRHVSEIGSAEELYRGARGRSIRRKLVQDKNQFVSCGRCPGLGFWDTKFIEYMRCAQTLVPGLGKRTGAPHKLSF
jgi:MoaA/NifB/PqqE/SkfB family radical SAM enzyme